jgi:methylmalonyl-CoA mutase
VGVDGNDPSPALRADPPLSGEGYAALATAFKQSGAKLACLCSSDEVYANEAAAAAQALAAAGAKHIYLAGRPGDLADTLKQAGVQAYVFAGCDALATLNDVYRVLGNAP